MAKAPKTPVIAITGATGFIGRQIMFHAFGNGCRTRALTRRPIIDSQGVTWVEGSLENEASLEDLVAGSDAVIHTAALVKAKSAGDFDRVNRQGTENLLKVLADKGPNRLVHLSSYAAREPGLSAYAGSKARAEEAVMASKLNWTIVRPPAVYGPGDHELVRLLRWMKKGYAFQPGGGDHRFAMMHAQDLAALTVMLARGATGKNKIIEADDGHADGYAIEDLARIVAAHFGRPVRTVTLPGFALKLLGGLGSLWATIFRQDVMLTSGKVRELMHADWTAEKALRANFKSWKPALDLETGLKRSFTWYQRAGLL